jgi:hypothetical protein
MTRQHHCKIQWPGVDACGKGIYSVPFELSMAQACLYLLHVLLSSGPRYWVVVPPLAQPLLELRLLCYRYERYGKTYRWYVCSQFVHHLDLWLLLELLTQWAILFAWSSRVSAK